MIAGEKTPDEDRARIVPAANARGRVFVPENIDASIGEMVGRLRHLLVSGRPPSPDQTRAAAALQELARRNVRGAHPDTWLGYPLATPVRLFSDRTIPVSPSNLERFEKSPLDWFVSSVAGGSSGINATIGTLVHRAIEVAPNGTRDELWAAVEEKWGEVNFEAPWLAEQWLKATRTMIDALADYVRSIAIEGRRVLDSEKFKKIVVRMKGYG
jgi:hypothetical protein